MKYAHRLMMTSLEDRTLLSAFSSNDRLPVISASTDAIVVAATISRRSTPAQWPAVAPAAQLQAAGDGKGKVASPDAELANARFSNLDIIYVSANDAVVSNGFGFSENHVGDQQ